MKNPVRIEIEYASGRKENRMVESGKWPEWEAALQECQQRGSVKSFSKINPPPTAKHNAQLTPQQRADRWNAWVAEKTGRDPFSREPYTPQFKELKHDIA